MKHFLNVILIWALLILACGLFYVAVAIPFHTSLANIIAFITAIFSLVQACGVIDKEMGYGKYDDSDEGQK